MLEVFGKRPGELTVLTDDAVACDRRNEIDFRARVGHSSLNYKDMAKSFLGWAAVLAVAGCAQLLPSWSSAPLAEVDAVMADAIHAARAPAAEQRGMVSRAEQQ